LALTTQYDLECHQLDVKTTFLNGYIEENIYMYIPEGLPTNPKLVCKLIKSLYGLKESSRAWYIRFDAYLILQGYRRLESDANTYIKKDNNDGFTIITVYVDGCLIINNKPSLIQLIKNILQQEFDMSDEGEIHYTLGNAIVRNRQKDWTIIHQQKYLTNKLQEFHMLNCNPLSTPMQSGIHLSQGDSQISPEEEPYPYS